MPVTGTHSGASCHPSQSAAAVEWCARVQVPVQIEGGGVMTCAAVLSTDLDTEGGGSAVFTWRSSVSVPGQEPATSKMVGQVLQPCDLYVSADWYPVITWAVGLLVAVWSWRVLIDFINGERSK